jgi:hypothetical protein
MSSSHRPIYGAQTRSDARKNRSLPSPGQRTRAGPVLQDPRQRARLRGCAPRSAIRQVSRAGDPRGGAGVRQPRDGGPVR